MNLLDRIAYDTGGYTVQEILSSFCKKILEIIDLVNKNEEICDEAHTLIENIRNEVVPDLVDDVFKELQDSGYFDNLVNVTLIENLRTELTRLLNQTITDYTNRLDNFDSELDTKVSYPILDNEVGVTNITYEYGNVKRYGAIGEISIEDNTTSFQNAIDSAYACGFNVYVPMGIYNILSTLYLPSRISIKGEITSKYVYDYVYNPSDFRGSLIISKCDYLFKPKNVNSYNIQETQLNMKEIMFLNRTLGSYHKTVLFKNMNLKSSNLENISTLDYSIVLMGWLSGVSTIKNCNFQGIYNYFIYSLKEAPNAIINELMLSDNPCLIDSYILDSYINGKGNATGAILFKGQGIAHSTISNNFMDYAKEVFRFTKSNKTSIISNNTFDVCYRIFKGKINSLNINGNSFNNCRYNSSYWMHLTDEEMINNEWGVLEPDPGFTDTNVTNNSSYQSDFLFKFDTQYSIYNITFNNNMLDCYLSEEPFQYKAVKGGVELDQTNIFLGDLMYKEYSTLPNPSLTISGGVYRITSFNGHIIRYKNRMLYNNNGKWCNMDGSDFIDS